MPISEIRNARDYNRSVAPPVRWIHVAKAALLVPLRPVLDWLGHPSRITWAPWAVIGGILIWLLLPFDEGLRAWAISLPIPGGLERELLAAQYFGLVLVTLLVALAIWLQDPARRARLADWGGAIVVTALGALALKMVLGRQRPVLDEPEMFLGPLGAYPLGPEIGYRAPWQFWDQHTSAIWSMPSSGAAFASVMAVFLAMTYPRLRLVAFGVLGLAAIGHAISGLYYITDIVAGVTLGIAVAHSAVTFRWGQRFLGARAARRGVSRDGGRAGKQNERGERGEIEVKPSPTAVGQGAAALSQR